MVAVHIHPTPNPNALKFEVATDITSPTTFVAGRDIDHPAAAEILALVGVTSVFMMQDFVTVSKAPDAPWEGIAEEAKRILEGHFPG
jgi:hypothetical protein